MSRPSKLVCIVALVLSMTLGVTPIAALAHLGDANHLHLPATATSPDSSVWCVSFTRDPGSWNPGDGSVIDASTLDGVGIVFEDCADILAGAYAIDSFAVGGGFTRTTVNEPVVGPGNAVDVAGGAGTEQPAYISVATWTKHQKQWLAQGDKLAARMRGVDSLAQVRKALASLQRHLRTEAQWLHQNAARSEPGSCLADDLHLWQKHVQRALKSLNRTITALNHQNSAAMSTNARQFARSWTKVEQVYNAGRCDF